MTTISVLKWLRNAIIERPMRRLHATRALKRPLDTTMAFFSNFRSSVDLRNSSEETKPLSCEGPFDGIWEDPWMIGALKFVGPGMSSVGEISKLWFLFRPMAPRNFWAWYCALMSSLGGKARKAGCWRLMPSQRAAFAVTSLSRISLANCVARSATILSVISLLKTKRTSRSCLVSSLSSSSSSTSVCSMGLVASSVLSGASIIFRNEAGFRSESLGVWSAGKFGASFNIVRSNSCVLNRSWSLRRWLSDHISADVNECMPGFFVVEFAEVAARNSKARRLKLARTFRSNSPAWQQSKMTRTSPLVSLMLCSAESHTISCSSLSSLGRGEVDLWGVSKYKALEWDSRKITPSISDSRELRLVFHDQRSKWSTVCWHRRDHQRSRQDIDWLGVVLSSWDPRSMSCAQFYNETFLEITFPEK